MFKNASEVHFSQCIGRFVELTLARDLLPRIYTNLRPLPPNFPWADYSGYRDERFWLISVKGRFMWDQYESGKAHKLTRNPNYKLDGKLDQALRLHPGAHLAWMTVAVNFNGEYEAYHGTVEHLRSLHNSRSGRTLGGTGVPMHSKPIGGNGYDVLEIGQHSFPFEDHKNAWAYSLYKDWKSRSA
jgi:hypothetical protein